MISPRIYKGSETELGNAPQSLENGSVHNLPFDGGKWNIPMDVVEYEDPLLASLK